VPVLVQVYVRLGSPPSSSASTERVVVLPVTGFGLAAAAVVMAGPALGTRTETVAVPLTPPLCAVTV